LCLYLVNQIVCYILNICVSLVSLSDESNICYILNICVPLVSLSDESNIVTYWTSVSLLCLYLMSQILPNTVPNCRRRRREPQPDPVLNIVWCKIVIKKERSFIRSIKKENISTVSASQCPTLIWHFHVNHCCSLLSSMIWF